MRPAERGDRRHSLGGVMVPLITPFTESLAVDWSALDDHVARLLGSGIDVVVSADLVGEAWALTAEEKAMLFERTVQAASGRATVIAKLSEASLPGCLRLALAARSAGVDAVKMTLPSAADGDAVCEYARAIERECGLPFLVETDGGQSPTGTLDQLLQLPGFIGVEEVSSDPNSFDDLVERYGAHIPIIAGTEDALGFTLLVGAAGFMTATPNFAPAFMRALWAAAAARDVRKTFDLYRRLRRYRRLFSADLRARQPMFATYTKAALEVLGHRAGPPRPPLRPLSTHDKIALAVVLREAFGLEPVRGAMPC
ncbi:MAG: dihydrodipicolinate synthase family protein [bacterium]